MTPEHLAAIIDHTNLKPETRPAQIEELCQEAIEHKFGAVCVNPIYVPLASKTLKDTSVKICTVVAFPLGACSTATKTDEATWALEHGAHEVDMVVWIGGIKAGRWDEVERDVAAVARTCADVGLLKVILECALLSGDEKRRACELSVRAGARFVKTSTGFGPGGATAEDVTLMANAVGASGVGVKAAGGIRTYEDAVRMVSAGATRLGTSASISIIEGAVAAQ